MKIVVFSYDAEIVTTPYFRYDKYRRPKIEHPTAEW
jgi:hypothetical protein